MESLEKVCEISIVQENEVENIRGFRIYTDS